ncbi:MAG TPA: TRAP transporter substrate-binding protein DctP [Clostridia bacterium]|nr:TRAP transporter substrate-binding protein DctP [Clostridia bacterium]
MRKLYIGEVSNLKKVSNIVILLLVLALVFGMTTGCGQTQKPQDQTDGSGGEQVAAEPQKIRIAGQSPIDHPSTIALMDLKERIERESEGRFQLEIFPANQLGDYTQVFQEVMRGTIDMALISVPSQFDSRLELQYMRYLANDYPEARKVYAQGAFLYNTMDKLFSDLDIKFLGFYVEGFGGLGLTKMPKEPLNPKVKKEVLLRVPPMDVFRQHAEDIGFTTVTVPYAELYVALQTGVAEGWSGGNPILNYLSFRDIIKYYLQFNDYMESNSFLVNKGLWGSFSAEDQKMFSDAVAEMSLKSIDVAEESDRLYLDKMREAGIEVYEYTTEELKPLADYTREVTWPKMAKRLGEEIINELMKQY